MALLLMAASIVGFTVYLNSHGPNNWALPIEVAIIVLILTVGLVFMWRARGH